MVLPFLAYVLLATSLALVSPTVSQAQSAKPEKIFLTWMSVANWLFEIGDTHIVTDGYISRIPQEAFSGLSFAKAAPTKPDEPAIKRLIEAIGGANSIQYILTGHSHYDHSFDTATWAKLTGARIIGARSTCLQAVAQGVPSSQCTAVEGGEVLPLGDHVTVRVVRWGHSGDVSTPAGQLLQAPLELINPPIIPPDAVGLRPGIVQDFPNGGGARAYLFTVATANGPVSWLYSNTGNAETFAHPFVVDKEFFQIQGLSLDNLEIIPQKTSVQDNLRAMMTAAGLDHVHLWIGYSDPRFAALVCSVLRPQAHIPHHWDGLFSSFFADVQFPYTTVTGVDELTAFLATQQVAFFPPQQYMDKFQLDSTGVAPVANIVIKEQLGFHPARRAAGAGVLAHEAAHGD